ncbi:MAG: O-antigen ligase family protein [Bacteroidetes bacterium]|nr:O-antigen ligase family protein [Bacteroidota bacterium]
MSLSQIILACNFLLEGGVIAKFKAFFKNKPALILSSLFLLHAIGLFYTTDFHYASNDMRIKMPLIVLPLIFSTSKPLSKQVVDLLLKVFVAAIIVGTIISTSILTGIIHRELVDIRSVSIFISHIRFALLICIALFVSGYYLYYSTKAIYKGMWLLIGCWLITFLIITESITGLFAFCFAALVVAFYSIFKSKQTFIRYSGGVIVLALGLFVFYLFSQINNAIPKSQPLDVSQLEKTTSRGNAYEHNINSRFSENGHYIWVNFCNKELEESWSKRSSIPLSEKDLKGNPVYFTLVRFLASKGLKKDADAVETLTTEEIKAIERGVVNVNYQHISSLKKRLHEISWELEMYKITGDPSGHSLTQRFEFWKAAMGIIKDNLVFGVGTGDVKMAFEAQYDKMNSPLTKEWRLRSHNQYLSIGVAFGLVGLIWFLITLFYPMVLKGKTFDYLYITFLLIAVVSFLTEDTLETQAGVTFYAFFNSFFLFIFGAQPLSLNKERGKG